MILRPATFVALLVCPLVFIRQAAAADETGLRPKPVPRLQAVLLPYDQVSLRNRGAELTRLHFGRDLHRPFLFPLIGPSGRELSRMGHPHDPEGHSHHNSIWISHFDLNGVDFWGDRSGARIRHERLLKLEDGEERAAVTTENTWRAPDDSVVLREVRSVAIHAPAETGWLLELDLKLTAEQDVTIGKTPFGFIGVRVAKSMGVHDGGGRILNSEGGVNEKEVFWQPARWVDYSGAVAEGVIEGVTLFDHKENPNHPAVFHVRDDGWMGASFSHAGSITLPRGDSLRLRYGIWVHAGAPPRAALDSAWQRYCRSGEDTRP